MRVHERIAGLKRSPKLLLDILARGRYRFTYDQMDIELTQMPFAKRWNLLIAGTHLVKRQLSPRNLPLHLQIELVNYCNLHCPVCPTGIGEVVRPPKAIDVRLFERVMDELGQSLLTVSLWGWGEPLLHPRLPEILRIAQKFPVAFFLSTNGQRLNDERILNALIDYPPTFLIVAIDGLTNETNARFRVGAKLGPILAGVRRLADLKRERGATLPILHMRHILMKHNEHEHSRLQEFARDNGFDLLTLRTLSIIDTAAPDRIHQAFIPTQDIFKAYDYKNNERVHRNDFVCMQPFWFPTVFADGTLVACEQDHNALQSLGVISKTVSFSDLWFGKHAARVRRDIRDTPQRISFCLNCPYADRATTDCSIQAIRLHDSIRYPVSIS
jgi:MoaA/NifB/PqqE/SkfB family radical SAM enzyme